MRVVKPGLFTDETANGLVNFVDRQSMAYNFIPKHAVDICSAARNVNREC
jgi:hypothetical protein